MGEGAVPEGRAPDVINIAGRKLNPAEVEARLAQCPGVRQVVVFGVSSTLRNEEAVACVSGSARRMRCCAMRGGAERMAGTEGCLAGRRVPVNDRGKVSRRGLARTYATMRR